MLHKGENLLCFSSQHSAFSTSLLTLRALPLWSPNVCEFFSHTERFSGISGCPLQFIQFWHSLRRDNIRSHTWRVQSPTSNANCKSRLFPVLVTNRLQIRGSHDPSLGSSNLLEWLRTQKNSLLTAYQFIGKEYIHKGYRWTCRWNVHRTSYVGKAMALSSLGPTLPAPPCVHPRSSPTLVRLGFLWKPHPIGMLDY